MPSNYENIKEFLDTPLSPMPSAPGADPYYTPSEETPKLTWEAIKAIADYFYRGVRDPIEKTMDAAWKGQIDPTNTLIATMMGIGAGWKGALPAGSEGVGLLAGRKAKYAPKRSMVDAIEMRKAGADAEEIWQEKKVVQGPERKWRWEIDDSKMNVKKHFDYGYHPLKEHIDHPELFKNYPEIAEADTWIKIDPDGVRKGYHDPSDGSIMVQARNVEEAKDVLIHEIQHWIQEKEGFASGGMSTEWTPGYARQSQELLEGYLNELDKLREANFTNKQEYMDYKRYLNQNIREARAAAQAKSAEDYYRRLFGEFESRDSASRRTWGPEERQMVRPYSSEIEPKAKWIVRQNET